MTHSCAPTLLRLLALAAVLSGQAIGCAVSQPLVQPRPILAAETPAQTRTAILRTLLREDWILEADQAGEIVASRGGSRWQIVVQIRYGEQVTISYVSSKGLDYQDTQGDPRIHGGYNSRVQDLMNDIGREITLVRATAGPAPVASPAPVQ